ncbi:protein translocase subunit SecD [Arenicella xantha]|uniref:Protein translocase subunit SecD n=1 Tax=Arenicella xantha TaxID=644221 RepID=A0A395JJC7_9GAMM|nr:protein translocase subunit SecD [Arenicella xantha]RBP50791.1 preprotein translocase subunit SecD [Arenicella xantha]
MNKNPTWKYLLLLFIVAFGVIYATPNLYQADPGLQVVGARTADVDNVVLQRVKKTLDEAGIEIKSLSLEQGKLRARLSSEDDQTRGQVLLKEELGDNYPVALADITTTPQWLQNLGGAPMYLGLDLRGGVHFLLQVDMAAAEKKANDDYYEDIRRLLREEGLRYSGMVRQKNGAISIRFADQTIRDQANSLISVQYAELHRFDTQDGDKFFLNIEVNETALSEIRSAALKKNMLALRNRIDQLGVSEPVIQQQGVDRIVVQLPGVKDPSVAKDILGKTATLQVHLVDEENQASNERGRVPSGSQRFYFRDGRGILLQKRVLYSGENIIDASASISQQDGGPVVSIRLDAKGTTINSDVTGDNIGKRMAVVYVESIPQTITDAKGNVKIITKKVEEVITAPTINDQLGKSFIITGLSSPKETQDIALLLRAGSLAAPVYIIEERTVGPSLGAENIAKGFQSVFYGFMAVLVFMVIFYRVFGAVASFALILNLVIIVGVLSLLQATLTLPGVAGMVLTVGMAVDANVLIFERIREEIQDGAAPQMAIHRGYDNAFSTIIDANLTTLIAALVLFNFGTGPIRGFAITLSIGIATSMVTAIFVTRVLVNMIYGNRRLDKLSM